MKRRPPLNQIHHEKREYLQGDIMSTFRQNLQKASEEEVEMDKGYSMITKARLSIYLTVSLSIVDTSNEFIGLHIVVQWCHNKGGGG